MEPNCKNKFNLDHVYCHPNETNYIRANAGSADVLAILKENKQLKAMLLLHLDLIQEQSDQLMTKEKLVASLREENDSLKLRLERMDRRLQLKSKTVDPPVAPSHQITNNNDVKKDSNLKILASDSSPPISPTKLSNTPALSPNTAAQQAATNSESKYKISDESYNVDSSVIGEKNGKFITKIILQRVQDPANKSPKSEEGIGHEYTTDAISTIAENTSSLDLTVKREPTSHDTEDSFSCGSGEQDRAQLQSAHKNVIRHGSLTTQRLYCTREWETEKIDEEINRDEGEALKSVDGPSLEIPKWIIKDFHGLYAIEGTEDLSDDTFMKRHNKLEMDEKRRKKWDVQRIREQRTIERLKRRHCKEKVNEVVQQNQIKNSFYPTADSIKYIQITEDIPVNAFGEIIPRITDEDFVLPWPELSPPAANVMGATSINATDVGIGSNSAGPNTALLVLKKRRRQHSQNATVHSKRPTRKLVIKN